MGGGRVGWHGIMLAWHNVDDYVILPSHSVDALLAMTHS